MLCRSCGTSGYIGGIDPPSTCPNCGAGNIRFHDELFSLTIAHVDCDAFYASVEKRDDKSLQDKPVIVGGIERGVVAAACYIARQYGVRSAMPTWQALKKCPNAIVIKPRMSHYVAISKEIREAMFSLTPLVQPISIDEAFLDMSGTEALHSAPPAVSLVSLQDRIRAEIGITVSIGLSGTKSLAKMASDRDKPDGFFVVGMAEAKKWLAPQHCSAIYGLGKSAVARLEAAGYKTCGDLVAADLRNLSQIMGKQAGTIQKRAAGIDTREVTTLREAKSISSETTFDRDLSTADELEAELENLCQKVSRRLKAQTIAGGRVTIKLKRPSHQTITRSQTLSDRTDRAHLLFSIARELLLKEIGPNRQYRLLGFGVDQLGHPEGDNLLSLAGGSEERKDRLEEALDQVHQKLGDDAVQSGRIFQRKHIKDGQRSSGQDPNANPSSPAKSPNKKL